MKILLTGASGATGGNLLRSGIFQDHQVYYTVHSETPVVSGVLDATALYCNLLNGTDVMNLPKVDTIIHAAAIVPKRAARPEEFNFNVQMARNLRSFAERKEIRNIVFISTGSVYGKNRLNKESDICEPADDYGKSMLEAESVFFKRGTVRVTIVRLFYPFGFDEFTKQDNFIARLFNKIISGEEITIGVDAENHSFKPIYFPDFSAIMKKLFAKPYHGVLNIAGDEAVTLPQLLEKMSVAASASAKIKLAENIPYPYNADTSLLHTILDDTHMTPLPDSLQMTWKLLSKTKVAN